MPYTGSTELPVDLSDLDARRAYFTGILHQVAHWNKIAEDQKLMALVELSNLEEDEKTLKLAIQLSVECADQQLLQKMCAIVQQKTLQTLEQTTQVFKLRRRQQSVASWVEAKRKKEEEEEQQVLASLAEEITELVQVSQRTMVVYQPPYVQATPLQQLEQVSPIVVSPSSSTAAPELTTADIQQLNDAKLDERIQSLEAKFEERLSRVENQAETNYQKLIDALKNGERRQKKEARKAKKKEDQARRHIFEDQLKLMQDMAAGSKKKKDDAVEKKEEEPSGKKD